MRVLFLSSSTLDKAYENVFVLCVLTWNPSPNPSPNPNRNMRHGYFLDVALGEAKR